MVAGIAHGFHQPLDVAQVAANVVERVTGRRHGKPSGRETVGGRANDRVDDDVNGHAKSVRQPGKLIHPRRKPAGFPAAHDPA